VNKPITSSGMVVRNSPVGVI